MLKTLVTSAIVANIAEAGFSTDFIKGIQTGTFITNEKSLADYQCPEPEISSRVENYQTRYNMAKGVLAPKKSSRASRDSPVTDSGPTLFDKIDQFSDQLAIVMSVTEKDYEGGDFCAGLIVGFEGRQVG